MNKYFPVDWQRTLKKASKIFPIAIVSPILLAMFLIFITSGFSYSETMGKMSISQLLTILSISIASGFIIAILASQWVRIYTVSISDGNLLGRNYYGIRRKIPFEKITELSEFSEAGIVAIVVKSKDCGEIFIYEHTQDIAQLIQILLPFLPSNRETTQAEPGGAGNRYRAP